MTKEEKSKQKIIIGLVTMLLWFTGVLTMVWGIIEIENYYRPYLFASIFCGLGLFTGIIFSRLLKAKTTFDKSQLDNFWFSRMGFLIGLMGTFLIAGALLNNNVLSKVDICDKYVLREKERLDGRFRSPEINYLFVDIDGQSQTLICKHAYWDTILVGQKIGVCSYKSKMGFDFISLTDK